jgi:hypothetical protein
MISGGAGEMAICDHCVRIRETVLILLKKNGEKSGAGRSCWLVYRGGPQMGLYKCSVRYMYGWPYNKLDNYPLRERPTRLRRFTTTELVRQASWYPIPVLLISPRHPGEQRATGYMDGYKWCKITCGSSKRRTTFGARKLATAEWEVLKAATYWKKNA